MHDLLIYLLDKESEDEIRQLFSGEKYKLTIVEDLELGAEVCQQELFDLALVWAVDFDKTNNFLTLLEVNQFNYIPVIAVVHQNQTAVDFLQLPLVDVIRLPVPKPEFLAIISGVLEDVDVQSTIGEGKNWQGSLEEYTLIDLIQMIENGERDAELIMSYENINGSVFFNKGKLVKAELLQLQGLDALAKMVFWTVGNFRTKLSELESVKDEIGKTNQEILIVLVERLLKQNQLYQGLPNLSEEVVKNPFAQTQELPSLQDRIANFCQTPISILKLLASLVESNEDIFLELKIMLQMGLLGRRKEIEAMVLEERERSSISKFFSSISSIFKKKPESGEAGMIPGNFEDEYLPPGLEITPLFLLDEEKEKIEKRLEAIS
jgi:hypothetical protein